jgi:hypothetical protein
MDRATAHEFFQQARLDPYLYAMTHHVLDAWTRGYLAALERNGLPPVPWDEAYEKAIAEMREEQARSLVAYSTLMGCVSHDAIAELAPEVAARRRP